MPGKLRFHVSTLVRINQVARQLISNLQAELAGRNQSNLIRAKELWLIKMAVNGMKRLNLQRHQSTTRFNQANGVWNIHRDLFPKLVISTSNNVTNNV